MKAMTMKTFHIIKKSARYSVKSFTDESKAREFAKQCSKANFDNNDYIVCIYNGGAMVEI